MGTRSTIALEFADGTVSQVYCHWDGYLEHNGDILTQYYSDPFKLRELIDLGDFSSLCATVEETKEGAYHFSRDEDYVVRRYKDVVDYFEECQQEEYDYILRNVDGKATWFVRCYATENRWVVFEEAQALIEIMNKQGAY
jgi:bifunctional DNA-binding transcriptional regulator/antitoxin component of YhaV-PrlF toxin-antitoxin module